MKERNSKWKVNEVRNILSIKVEKRKNGIIHESRKRKKDLDKTRKKERKKERYKKERHFLK